jgi:hypothetical protein
VSDINEQKMKLDALLGRALRDKAFREKLIANTAEVATEAGLSAEELDIVVGGLTAPQPGGNLSAFFCTEKTCNETGGARKRK